jgi:hypothetical protein
VAAHRVNLGNQRDLERRIGFRHGDGRAQTGSAPPNDYYISLEDFHAQSFLAYAKFPATSANLTPAEVDPADACCLKTADYRRVFVFRQLLASFAVAPTPAAIALIGTGHDCEYERKR